MQENDRVVRRKHVEERIKELKRKKRLERQQQKGPSLFSMSLRRTRSKPLRIIALTLIAFFLISLLGALVQLSVSKPKEAIVENQLQAKNSDDLLSQIGSDQKAITPPRINAKAAVLMEARSRQVLYSLNPEQKLPNASTTKILTGIIVLENANLEDKVIVSQRAASTGEQAIGMKPGEVLTVEELLYALLVYSANDAAVALAEHVAGSVEGFAEIMNRKARELGATGTNFTNPHGLDDKNHYTTALDLALIGAYAMNNAEFRKIVNTDQYTISLPPRTFNNHNKLLKIYPYANGIKTGYTGNAGKCLVGSAEKNNTMLISVVLNDENYFNDSAQLLEYGFNSFVKLVYAEAGDQLAEVRVGRYPERDVKAVALGELSRYIRKDKLSNYMNYSVNYHAWLPYPVKQGQELGLLKAVLDGVCLEVPLVAERDLGTPNILTRTASSMYSFWKRVFKFLIPGL